MLCMCVCLWQGVPVVCPMRVGDFCAAPFVESNLTEYYRARIEKRVNDRVQVAIRHVLLLLFTNLFNCN